jgi:hypothetical protein
MTKSINNNLKGQCELYIIRPLLPVSVATAVAKYPFSIIDAYRMYKDV